MAEHTSGVSCYLVSVALAAASSGLIGSYEALVFSSILLHVKEELYLTTQWHQTLAGTVYITGMLSALGAGYFSDVMGRKSVIMASSLVHIVGDIVVALSYHKGQILGGRLFVGMSLGLSTTCVPVYLSEIAVTAVRGRIGNLYYLFYGFGLVLGSLLGGAFATVPMGWRYMAGLGGFVPLVQFTLFFFAPESPRWLLSKGREIECKENLLKLRTADYPTETELDAIRANVKDNVGKGGFKQIFKSPPVRRALLVGALLHMSQAFTGFYVLLVYSTLVVAETGLVDRLSAMWVVMSMAGVGLIGLVAGLVLVERVGRRLLVLTSLLGVTVALLFVATIFTVAHVHSPAVELPAVDPECEVNTCTECLCRHGCGFCYTGEAGDPEDTACVLADSHHHYRTATSGPCSNKTLLEHNVYTFAYKWCPYSAAWLIVFGLSILTFFYLLGIGPLTWTINGEIFPMWARSLAASLTSSVNWACNLVLSLTFLTLVEHMFKHGVFYILAGINIVFFVVFFFILPETMNVSLEDIEKLFQMPLGTRKVKRSSVTPN